MKDWFHAHRTEVTLYAAALAVYLGCSNRHLLRQSFAPHLVYQAHAFLHGRLSLDRDPPNQEDWARIETLTLRDGRTVRGQFLAAPPNVFTTTHHQSLTLPPQDILARRAQWYVSFPPFPALLMMPVVALGGLRTNDVLFTLFMAALVPPLLFVLLQLLAARGLAQRTQRENLWLVALFSVGSVFFYASLSGGVWYTAHVVACVLTLGYGMAALEATHPAAAGLLFGLAVATRVPLIAMFPLFVLEAWRCRRAELRPVLLRFAAPAAAIGLGLAVFNYARFDSPFEFGHTYLTIRWAGRIQHWGLFNYHFLSRNLAAAFTLLPKLITHPPYLQTSRHGLSLLVTTPALAYLLWPTARPPLHRALWLTILPIALQSFLYQNDGWIQFGYRFSLDYMVFLVALLAIGGRPLSRTFRLLILAGILVNLFGALTFDQLSSRGFYDGFFPAE